MIRRFSRRDFVRGLLAGAAGLSALILASCGGSTTSSSTAATTAAGTASSASPASAIAATPAMSMPMSPVAALSPTAVSSGGYNSPAASPTAVASGATPTAATTAPAATVKVKIVEPSTNFNTWSYQPKSITVKAGTTVTWVNTGGATHTVTADNKAFDSGSIAPGHRFSLKTTTAGTFTYHCAFHPWMKGTLIVMK